MPDLLETREDLIARAENASRVARKFAEGSTRQVSEGVRKGPGWTACVESLRDAVEALAELARKESR
jgi:hypothetical protein